MWKFMLLLTFVLLITCHAVAEENSESVLSFDALNASDSDTFSDSDIALVSTNVDILSNSSCCAAGRCGCAAGRCGCAAGRCGGSCRRPRWRFAADALFLRRSTPDDRPLLVGDNAVAIGQNAADIDFSTDTGWRLTARRPLRAGYELDISYFDFNTDGCRHPRSMVNKPHTLISFIYP